MAKEVRMHLHPKVKQPVMLHTWHKKQGDFIKTGEILFSYRNEEGIFDYPSKHTGRILTTLMAEGSMVENGAILFMLDPEIPVTEQGVEQVPYVDDLLASIKENNLPNLFYPFVGDVQKDAVSAEMDRASVNLATLFPPEIKMGQYVQTGRQPGFLEKKDGSGQMIAAPVYETIQGSFHADAVAGYAKRLAEESADATIKVSHMIVYAVLRLLTKYPLLNAKLHQGTLHFCNHLVAYCSKKPMEPAKKSILSLLDQSTLSQLAKIIYMDVPEGPSDPGASSAHDAAFYIYDFNEYGIESLIRTGAKDSTIFAICATEPKLNAKDDTIDWHLAIRYSMTYNAEVVDTLTAAQFLRELENAVAYFDYFLTT